MERMECSVCGFVYDDQKGDHWANVPAGTEFARLPEGWRCPLCNSPVRFFGKASDGPTKD